MYVAPHCHRLDKPNGMFFGERELFFTRRGSHAMGKSNSMGHGGSTGRQGAL
jgi:hypothetical protein